MLWKNFPKLKISTKTFKKSFSRMTHIVEGTSSYFANIDFSFEILLVRFD